MKQIGKRVKYMNIKRIIDKNRKLILYIIGIIAFILFIIKALNSYYEKDERKKQEQLVKKEQTVKEEVIENDFSIESNSVEKTTRSFVNYCNKRELENAYKMLTEECKKAMFPTVDIFEKVYINVVYKINRDYNLTKWSTDGNKSTYLVKLYGDILATGNANNYTEEYYTFVKDANGNYKLNINNYIYGEDRNIVTTASNITVKIGHVDVYEEYEEAEITVTNNSSKTISLTGGKYRKNIYLKNATGTGYSPLNSDFESDEIIMKPNSTQNFKVMFNKAYDSKNKAVYLVLSDIILDYEEYLNVEDKTNYSNRTSIKMRYPK